MMSNIPNTSTTPIDPDNPPTTEQFWEGAVLKHTGQTGSLADWLMQHPPLSKPRTAAEIDQDIAQIRSAWD